MTGPPSPLMSIGNPVLDSFDSLLHVAGSIGESAIVCQERCSHQRVWQVCRDFVEKGIAEGKRQDLTDGGYFVGRVVESVQEAMEKRYALRARGQTPLSHLSPKY